MHFTSSISPYAEGSFAERNEIAILSSSFDKEQITPSKAINI
jgi:hypothetical protein